MRRRRTTGGRRRPIGSAVLAVVGALLALGTFLEGPRRVAECSTDADGHLTIGGQLDSLCEVPDQGTVTLMALFLALSVWGTVRVVRARRAEPTEPDRE